MEEELTSPPGHRSSTFLGAIAFIAAAVWLANEYTDRSRERERICAYNRGLELEAARLRQQAQDAKAMAVALRDDPFLIEQRMRRTFGLVRPGDIEYKPVKVEFKRAASLTAERASSSLRSKICALLAINGKGLHHGRFVVLSCIFGMMGLVLMTMKGQKAKPGRDAG